MVSDGWRQISDKWTVLDRSRALAGINSGEQLVERAENQHTTMEHNHRHSSGIIVTLTLDHARHRGESVFSGQRPKLAPLRVLVCRLREQPTVELLQADEDGSYLTAMQQIIGGRVWPVPLSKDLHLWSSRDNAHRPLHREVPVTSPLSTEYEAYEITFVGDARAATSRQPCLSIRGDFLLTRCTSHRHLTDITDADIAHYKHLWREPVAPQEGECSPGQ